MVVIKSKYLWISALRASNFRYYIHIIGNQNYILLKTLNEASCAYLLNKIKKKEGTSSNIYCTISGISSVAQSCPTLCDPMNCSTPSLPVHHQLPEATQRHVHWVGDAIQPSYPLLSPFLPALNLSQHQGLFKWVNSLHQVAKVLEFQLQHQSFQWTLRTDLL